MIKPVIIFGNTQMAELAWYYFTHDTSIPVAGFCVDEKYINNTNFCHLPVTPFETVQETYPPDQYSLFIGLAYSNLNQLRKQKYLEGKAKGYQYVSYISSKATLFISKDKIGENCFILEDNTIQPFVEIGNNVILWSGNHLGHHSKIGDHCFIASHAVISGNVQIEEECFIGVNATIRNGITIKKASVIGASAWIHKDTDTESVYIADPTVKSKLPSSKLKKI